MSWVDEMRAVADDVIAEFSDVVVYTQGRVSVAVSANFKTDHVKTITDPDGVDVNTLTPALSISMIEAEAKLTTRPRRNDTFQIDGKTYQVEETHEMQTYYFLLATEVA